MANISAQCISIMSYMYGSTEAAKNEFDRRLNNQNKTETASLYTDGFVSTTKEQNEISVTDEYNSYKNFFKAEENISKISGQIEYGIKSLVSSGKSVEETVAGLANMFEISPEDAAEIFTEEFISDILDSDDEVQEVAQDDEIDELDAVADCYMEQQENQAVIDEQMVMA